MTHLTVCPIESIQACYITYIFFTWIESKMFLTEFSSIDFKKGREVDNKEIHMKK